MSHLKVRKIPFEFSNVRFLWNPANPEFSTFMNQFSFFALGVERYFCKAMKDAEPLIRDPEVQIEARLFKEQEAQHSLCHRRHVNALIGRYPGLQAALDDLIAFYDELYRARDLPYHLAYAADTEATFPPLFRTLIDYRGVLFRQGDSRVASLNLWHFCEEIEHRSSALIVYNEVVGDTWYRIRQIPSVVRHVLQALELLAEHFDRHVPAEERCEGYSTVHSSLDMIPLPQRLATLWSVLWALLPWHDPAHERPPNWSHKWFQHESRGEDMTNFYGTRPAVWGRRIATAFNQKSDCGD